MALYAASNVVDVKLSMNAPGMMPRPAHGPTVTVVTSCEVSSTDPVILFKPLEGTLEAVSVEPLNSCRPAKLRPLLGVPGPSATAPKLEDARDCVLDVASLREKGMSHQML